MAKDILRLFKPFFSKSLPSMYIKFGKRAIDLFIVFCSVAALFTLLFFVALLIKIFDIDQQNDTDQQQRLIETDLNHRGRWCGAAWAKHRY